MLELTNAKKNRVSLHDYNFEQDIRSRTLLSDFSVFDVEVLAEIIFQPLKISLKKLARQVNADEEQLQPLLKKLSEVGLLTWNQDNILIDKDMRKYFEFELMRFNDDFKPDLEFIQGLLRKVPIHVLPNWYSIPRTSNNIFESIIEKYLLTPHIFQRYISELNLADPVVGGIVKDLFLSPDFTVHSSDLIAKYNLSRRNFEEIILLLEFHFICCLRYKKEGDHWLETLTPFHEWHQHLRFLQSTEAPHIEDESTISRTGSSDFAFVEEMTSVLKSIRKKGKSLDQISNKRIVEKLCLIQLASIDEERLVASEAAASWIDMSLEEKALHLYRHPLNRLKNAPTQHHVREAEKAIRRALHGKWVYFEDFVKGALVSLSENSVVMLKQTGKHWKYLVPTYTEAEKELIRATLFEWLYEAGMVATGICHGRDCFAVTAFGRFLFEE